MKGMELNRISAHIIFFLFFTISDFSYGQELFSYNKTELDEQFKDLKLLEGIVKSSPGITMKDLQPEYGFITSELKLSYTDTIPIQQVKPPLGIPAFFWGLVLGPVGVIVIMAATKGSDEKMNANAVYGCFSNMALLGCYYLIWNIKIGYTESKGCAITL